MDGMNAENQACRDCPHVCTTIRGLHCDMLNMNVEYCFTKPCKAGD